MESAGVDWGAKMLGTGLSVGGLAAHNPAARSIPANKTSTAAKQVKLFACGLWCFPLSLCIKFLHVSPMPSSQAFGLLLLVNFRPIESVAILWLHEVRTSGSHPGSLHMHIASQSIRF
jgi:hypothetical protein